MHSRSMQRIPPIGIFCPSVVAERSNSPAANTAGSAAASDTESNFYATWKAGDFGKSTIAQT